MHDPVHIYRLAPVLDTDRRSIAFAIVITNIGLMIALLIWPHEVPFYCNNSVTCNHIFRPRSARSIPDSGLKPGVAGSLLKLKILSNWRAELFVLSGIRGAMYLAELL